MALTPSVATSIGRGAPIETPREQTSRTYRIDFAAGRVRGMTDGLEAAKQAVQLVLNTERYRYLIYSWNYGIEVETLFGKSQAIVESEIKRVVREALLQDGRIDSVENFTITNADRRSVAVSFVVSTKFGSAPAEVVVNV